MISTVLRRFAAQRLFVALPLLQVLITPASASAQLFPANPAGVSMGHLMLNVGDVEAHQAFWTKFFGARTVTVGTLQGVTLPGLVVLFRTQRATGPLEGTSINHMGLKVTNMESYLTRLTADGWTFDPPRAGREMTPTTYVNGPEGFRVELIEDSTLPRPAINHHVHYALADIPAVRRWYVETLGAEPTVRTPFQSADLPGVSLTLGGLGSQTAPGVPTKGRLLDGIGFEVKNLRAYCEMLRAKGVAFEKEFAIDPELGVYTATIIDPWGVTIRLTEGLSTLTGGTVTLPYKDRYIEPSPL